MSNKESNTESDQYLKYSENIWSQGDHQGFGQEGDKIPWIMYSSTVRHISIFLLNHLSVFTYNLLHL